MDEKKVLQLWMVAFHTSPTLIKRCAVGIGNYVFYIESAGEKYIVRCSSEVDAYGSTRYWLGRLNAIHIPVPQVITWGTFEGFEYLVLSYLEGKDIGLVYTQLTDADKRNIAKEVVRIQNQVALMELEDVAPDWSWYTFVQDMLDRAQSRIKTNGYFETEKVEQLRVQAAQLGEYFSSIKSVAYLDDISSKNLIIHQSQISGIVDIDWIGIGDRLTFAALTNVALLNFEYDTDYVTYILEEMQLTAIQKKAFLFYSLLYCVDFMGERGMRFGDKEVAVNQKIVDRLNSIYNQLWNEWNLLNNI